MTSSRSFSYSFTRLFVLFLHLLDIYREYIVSQSINQSVVSFYRQTVVRSSGVYFFSRVCVRGWLPLARFTPKTG